MVRSGWLMAGLAAWLWFAVGAVQANPAAQPATTGVSVAAANEVSVEATTEAAEDAAAEPDAASDDEQEATTQPARTARRSRGRAAAPPSPQVAVFELRGRILEKPSSFGWSFDLEMARTLHDWLTRLESAATDDRVKAVVLLFDNPMIGWGQMQELRAACRRLRDAQKDVYCYLEEAGVGTYLLATAASRICMPAAGNLNVAGLHAESVYLKGLLDKIGVEADIEHMGAYKGAGEPFTRTGPSDEAREMLDWLLDDLYAQMVETIADGRQMDADHVRELIDRGPFNALEALEAQLIDEILDADEFLESLRERHGQQLELVHNYGAPKGTEIDLSSPLAFFKILGEAMGSGKPKKSRKNSIALIYVEGLISMGRTQPSLFGDDSGAGSTTLRRVLAQARQDDSVKAVVLRVDSPGGSATASDIIWRATRDTAGVKPTVVSMGNMAASGGYYLAVGAPTIFADQATLTGSIGVIGGKLVTKGLWDWLGVAFHEQSRGRNADLYNTNRRFDDDQRALIRCQLDQVYGMFLDRVRGGREDRLVGDLDKLAGGRVFTGRQALAHGLIDRLGGLNDAIACAAEQAGVSDYEIRVMPEAGDFFQLLMKSLTGEEDESGEGVSLRGSGGGGWMGLPAVRELLDVLRRSDPGRAAAAVQTLLRLQLLRGGESLLVMPHEVLVR